MTVTELCRLLDPATNGERQVVEIECDQDA
jgi:hypothetical protein